MLAATIDTNISLPVYLISCYRTLTIHSLTMPFCLSHNLPLLLTELGLFCVYFITYYRYYQQFIIYKKNLLVAITAIRMTPSPSMSFSLAGTVPTRLSPAIICYYC